MGAATTRPPRGDANVATVLTWLVPGAGHVYLGAPIFGICAFLAVTGVYLLGIRLSDGMAFEFLELDLRSAIAPILTPEVGNLSAVIWHMRAYGFGLPFPRPWPAHIELGTWLTAASGMLNVGLACQAHFLARVPKGLRSARTPPGLLVLAGWALPGLGHWLQGRRLRALIVFLVVAGLVGAGTWLGQGANLDRERHFYYWSAQFLAGLPVAGLEVLHGNAAVTGDIPYADAGLALASVGGLLNVLALLDIYGVAERSALDALEPARASRPAQEAAA